MPTTKKQYALFSMLCFGLVACRAETDDGIGTSEAASSTTQAFNPATGALNVDYAGYLSKHDVVFNSPITDPVRGLTVGNGRVGAQVWNSNGLTMQVTGVDNSPQTCFSSGIVNLFTNPGMDTGTTRFQQRLSLYDGLITTSYDSNRTVTIMGSPSSEVLGIHVDDSRSGVSSVIVELSLWDLSGLPSSATSMFMDVPSMATWKTVATYTDSNGAGISRGQTDANRFGYTLAASVEGANFTSSVVSGSKVRLTITPSPSYTIWIANATRLNAPNNDSVAQAKNLLSAVKATGYATTLTRFKRWWHDFWQRSFVQYSNAFGDADYLENYYYLANYIIGSGSFGNYPFHFIHGVYSGVQDNDADKWSGAYWYWNQRDVYYSLLASNRINAMDSFWNLYLRNFDAIKSHTQSRFGIDGVWVPETMGWDGNARHTDESDYTKNILSTGAELSQYLYYRYKYTNDAAFLSRAYPMMREVAKFYTSKLSFNGSSGKFFMASSNAHETYWNVPNAITDLMAVRAMFPMAIEAGTILGQDSSLRSQWQNVLNNIQPYPSDSTQYLPKDPSSVFASNVENVVLELAWPYSVTGLGSSDLTKVVSNWNSRPFPYRSVWSPDAIQAARLGLGDAAFSGMKTMLQNYQSFPNGLTSNTNGDFEYIGVHPSAMNESLLQSYDDRIRVFPAPPNDASFVGKFTLLASGGFLVSSEQEASEIKYVGLKSLFGKMARVVNPWGLQQVQVRRTSDGAIILSTSGSEISFNTVANSVYVIERTAKPLAGYTPGSISGTANQNEKSLSGTSCTLGADSAQSSRTLTVSKAGTGSGTVISSNMNCGNVCSASYPSGTSVTLTASPAGGSTFVGWAGACSGTGACTVTMSMAQTVTATFNVGAPTGVLAVNAGGSATGSFAADSLFSGGGTSSTTSAIDTSLIPAPVPPQAVFQTERFGDVTYTVASLPGGSPQTVTLYFAEIFWTSSGKRSFDVVINGSAVLSAFDIFAAAGGANRAIARTFSTTANSSGQVVIQLARNGGADNPKISGIAVTSP